MWTGTKWLATWLLCTEQAVLLQPGTVCRNLFRTPFGQNPRCSCPNKKHKSLQEKCGSQLPCWCVISQCYCQLEKCFEGEPKLTKQSDQQYVLPPLPLPPVSQVSWIPPQLTLRRRHAWAHLGFHPAVASLQPSTTVSSRALLSQVNHEIPEARKVSVPSKLRKSRWSPCPHFPSTSNSLAGKALGKRKVLCIKSLRLSRQCGEACPAPQIRERAVGSSREGSSHRRPWETQGTTKQV